MQWKWHQEPGLTVGLEGYLDNRAELRAALGLRVDGDTAPSDAALVAAVWRNWGESGLKRLSGPVVAAIADLRDGQPPRVVLYREPLGRRGLHYRVSAQALLVASEPAALLLHAEVSIEPDNHWLTRYFALARPRDNRTPFRDVRKLLPGQCLTCTPDALTVSREPLALGRRPVRYGSATDYAEHFRALLDQAVARTLTDGGERIGIMLSGGMDSGPIAALAQRRLSTEGRSLTAYSWSLPDYPSADESAEIAACSQHVGCGLRLLPSADDWPFRDLDRWPVNPNSPCANAYRRLKLGVYRAAAEEGCRVVLNAAAGDLLYPHPGHCLTDAWRDRRFGFVLRDIGRTIRSCGPIGLWYDSGLRGLGKHLIGWRRRTPSLPVWLAPGVRQIWRESGPAWPPESAHHPRPDHYQAALDQWAADGLSEEVFFASRCGIDRRDPFRDLDLIDFMLSIPSDVCYRDYHTKWLAREAMHGLLPDSIRLRPRGGLLNAFFDAGFQRERESLRGLLTAPNVAWPTYVDRSWLMRALESAESREIDRLIVWNCAAFELWRRALSGEHPDLLDFAQRQS